METQKTGEKVLSRPVIGLMRGVVSREEDPALFHAVLESQILIRDYVGVIGLELMVDEIEGYAWLKTRTPEEGETPLPRLVIRRQLSYPVSLIMAMLRKRLAENDAMGGDIRLILSVDEIADAVKVFFPAGVNEARFVDRIDTHLNKIAELGFVRRLKGQKDKIEVLRIMKAFVDAQWLNEFDQRLKSYREMIQPEDDPI